MSKELYAKAFLFEKGMLENPQGIFEIKFEDGRTVELSSLLTEFAAKNVILLESGYNPDAKNFKSEMEDSTIFVVSQNHYDFFTRLRDLSFQHHAQLFGFNELAIEEYLALQCDKNNKELSRLLKLPWYFWEDKDQKVDLNDQDVFYGLFSIKTTRKQFLQKLRRNTVPRKAVLELISLINNHREIILKD